MGGYTKNIAVIKGIKEGFSADGGQLSGLVKAEKYGAKLRVELSYINFAPLTEGRYLCAVSDGTDTQIVEGDCFEGESHVDTGNGFAALICYVHGQVYPVASAVCGNFHGVTLGLKEEVEKAENLKKEKEKPVESDEALGDEEPQPYEDEAIAEVNYYEYEQTSEDRGALCADKKEEETRGKAVLDEAAFGSVEERENGLKEGKTAAYSGGNGQKDSKTDEEPAKISPLSRGKFYERVKGEIEGVLGAYPKEENLEKLIEGSRWVKINYGGEKYYVFGVLYENALPRYICYGVPAAQNATPPESMEGYASFLPCSAEGDDGYWFMYQDAETGASVKVEAE